MKIESIHLRNFRNYENLRLSLHPSLTLLIGENGSGKTNILESLLFVSNLRSFRCDKDQEMIQKGWDSSCIDVYLAGNRYRVIVQQKGKCLYVNDSAIRKSSTFLGRVNCILFKPEDIYLFEASPKERRDLLNIEIGKIDSLYLRNLSDYEKLLKDKNALLKQQGFDETYLGLIEERMVDPIFEISRIRREFVEFLSVHAQKYFALLSGLDKEIRFVYKGNDALKKEEILSQIRKYREKEKILEYSMFGPQKDDFSAQMDTYPLSSYASQGQKRMVLISLRLAVYDFILEKTEEEPIILLDDILSELDKDNRKRLFACIPPGAQTVLTATEDENIAFAECLKYRVSKGEIYGE